MSDENKDLDRFEVNDLTTDETLETMTEYTDGTLNNDSFQESTGQPPKTTEMGLGEDKKKSKIPIIIFGFLLAIVILFVGMFLFSGDDEENNKDQVTTEQTSSNDITEDIVMNDDIVEVEDDMLTIGNDDDLNLSSSTNDNELINIDETNEIIDDNGLVTDNLNVDSKPSISPLKQEYDETNTSETTIVNEELQLNQGITTDDIEKVIEKVQKNNEVEVVVDEEEKEKIITNDLAYNYTPKELRNVAEKLMEKASVIETYGNIEEELANKTKDEQIEYLKSKLMSLQLDLTQKNIDLENLSAKKVVKPVVKKEVILTADAIIPGQVWVNNKSYVVGDKLPNNSIIKNINNDTGVVETNKGIVKLKEK